MRTAALLLLTITLLLPAQEYGVVRVENWRVQEGDNPAWAAPDFDDSAWPVTSWPTRRTSATALYGGYRWYRAKATVAPNIGLEPLAIGLNPIDEVYEVFVDGKSVGRFGSFEPKPGGPFLRHVSFVIPASRDPVLHIAIRRWTGRSPTNYSIFFAGQSERHPPRLGGESVVALTERYHNETFAFAKMLGSMGTGLVTLTGLFSLALFLVQRSRYELLWLGLALVSFGLPYLAGVVIRFSELPLRSLPSALAVFAYMASRVTLVLFLAAICAPLRRPLRVVALVPAVWAVLIASGFLFEIAVPAVDSWLWEVPEIGAALVTAGTLVRMRDRYSALLAFTLCLWLALQFWSAYLRHWLGFAPPGVAMMAGGIADPRTLTLLLFAVLALLGLYVRYRRDEQRRTLLEVDLAAASKVQASLLPVPERAGSSVFQVDAIYLPAREVGGDFWQTVAYDDGSLLLVTGDVSGKGLPAAMLVAAVAGALGTLQSRRPAEVLSHLNRALQGKAHGGFVTCCCALFEPSGTVTLANAGHLTPFREGNELTTDGNLPLGIAPDVVFPEVVLRDASTPVTFLSDGVVEAANASGELFGFERAREISRKIPAEIAEAARRWGQNDDITVVTVRRAAAA